MRAHVPHFVTNDFINSSAIQPTKISRAAAKEDEASNQTRNQRNIVSYHNLSSEVI